MFKESNARFGQKTQVRANEILGNMYISCSVKPEHDDTAEVIRATSNLMAHIGSPGDKGNVIKSRGMKRKLPHYQH